MSTRLGSIVLLALVPTSSALAQSANELFTEGHELVDEWMSMRHVVDLDGAPPLDVIGWWWMPESNQQRARVRAWVSDGLGGLQEVWELDTPSLSGSGRHRNGSTLGDFNGDGKQDFVLGFGPRAYVYTDLGAPAPTQYAQFLDPWDSFQWQNPLGLVATDVDGDGYYEVISASPRSMRIWRNLGADGPGFELNEVLILIEGPGAVLTSHHIEIALGELDGDPTRKELVVLRHSDQSGVELRIYQTEGVAFSVPTVYPVAVGFDSHLVIGDIDGNGLDDVVLFGKNGQYQVLRQTAPGQLVLEPLAHGGPSTHLVDINGNGLLDGICCSSGPGGSNPPNTEPSLFRVALNDGRGGFAPAVTFPGLGSQRIAGAVDMDGDGDLDLLGGRMILFNHLVVGTSYCEATPNSSGQAGSIAASGSSSLARADLDLVAMDVPVHKLGLFFYGPNEVQVPFGAGYRCVGGQIYRLGVLLTDAQGQAVHRVDYDSPRATSGQIEAGSTWRFQFWFRDPAGAGGSFNFSDGLRVTFGP